MIRAQTFGKCQVVYVYQYLGSVGTSTEHREHFANLTFCETLTQERIKIDLRVGTVFRNFLLGFLMVQAEPPLLNSGNATCSTVCEGIPSG